MFSFLCVCGFISQRYIIYENKIENTKIILCLFFISKSDIAEKQEEDQRKSGKRLVHIFVMIFPCQIIIIIIIITRTDPVNDVGSVVIPVDQPK